MASKARNKTRHRTHKLGGCATCRKRHTKCDRVRPECLTCRAEGWKCGGYSIGLKWVNNGQSADNAREGDEGTRAHLYRETTRAFMSQTLLSDLSSRSVDETLSELDARSRNPDVLAAQGMAAGPFGVFGLAQQTQNSLTSLQQPYGTTSDARTSVDLAESTDTIPTLLEDTDPSQDIPDLLDWDDLFDLDMMNTANQLEPFNSQSLAFANPQGSVDHTLPMQQPDFSNSTSLRRDATSSQLSFDPPFTTSSGTALRVDDIISMSDAHHLLRHLRDRVIPQLVPMPNGKKPLLEVLHFDFAIVTLATTTFMASKTIPHAALTNLYSLLALAAKHLNVQPNGTPGENAEDWNHFASIAIQRAKSHLKSSLSYETNGPQATKYKHQVMAITSMLAYTVLTNDCEGERAYMIDAERLLRQRGLIKRNISRRARLLHHMYTWLRIIHESMYVLHDFTRGESLRNAAEDDLPECESRSARPGHNPRLDDFLRLDRDHAEGEREWTFEPEKDQENGLRDIHLEDSRKFEGFFFQRYGVSEAWLSLLSQTTRLANVIDRFEACKDNVKTVSWSSIKSRKQRLENKICALASKSWQTDQCSKVDRNLNNAQHSMVRALNIGLVIFYYRRACDVNSWILQDHVYEIMNALQQFEAACTAQGFHGSGSPWPAFVAGCESLKADQRKFFEGWFDRAIAHTGMPRLIAAKSCMLDVWKRWPQISQTAGLNLRNRTSWVLICKEQNLHLLLS